MTLPVKDPKMKPSSTPIKKSKGQRNSIFLLTIKLKVVKKLSFFVFFSFFKTSVPTFGKNTNINVPTNDTIPNKYKSTFTPSFSNLINVKLAIAFPFFLFF